jgi:hypothetical protein
MIELIFAFLIALGCLCLVFLVFGQLGETTHKDVSPVPRSVAGVRRARRDEFALIFRAEDYSFLNARPDLRNLGSRLWRDRRRIALKWLLELRTDVHVAWTFRRFVVRNGLNVAFRDETVILLMSVLSLGSLALARSAVFLCGPFLFGHLIERTAVCVEGLSHRCDLLVCGLPGEKRAEIEKKWAQEMLFTAG